MKRQLSALCVSVVAGITGIVVLWWLWWLGILLLLLAVFAWKVAVGWQRKHPIPMPSSLRWAMFIPRGHSPKRLKRILEPRSGEQMLEVGPGPGVQALPLAEALLPAGTLDVLDIQQEMLDALNQRATKRHITNIRATLGDAQKLPYSDGAFDAVYMIGTLGEIPNQHAALVEFHRVLKPDGRLVIAEVIIDPDFISLADLKKKADEAGFAYERSSGLSISYFARFKQKVKTQFNATVYKHVG